MVVLGMHRCGASLTARVLSLLGVDLGLAEDGREPEDPGGNSGQRPIVEINDAILEALGGSRLRPPEMAPGWTERPEIEALKPAAREVIAIEVGHARRWGWKDPRTSLTLPFWREMVPQARYVVCLRRPTDVAASLLRLEPEAFSFESAGRLWLRYNAEALENTRRDERLVVFYDDYFTDRDRQLQRIAEFVGGDDLHPSSSSQASSVIESDLRHHRTSAAEVADADDLPLEARSLFLLTRMAQVSTLEPAEREAADRVEPGLVEAIERFAPQLWDVARTREEMTAALSRHDDALSAAQAERDSARRAERQHRVALDRALEELESLRGGPDATQEERAKEIERRERALVRARADLETERRARLKLQDSFSWKVTRPLRWGKRALLRSA